MKTCTKCSIIKPFTEFYRRGHGYKSQCKECCSEYGKKNYLDNKELHNKKMVEHYESNKARYKETQKKYRVNNKEKINLIAKEYSSSRFKTDIIFKLKHNLRIRINQFIKSSEYSKSNSMLNIIGCTPQELKLYLESKFKDGMSWENYGEWHIDHIIPLAFAENINELYNLNYYLNLQPMWRLENLKKGQKLIF
jgi:hypothetical protein